MNNFIPMILLKWTLLLALGWAAHGIVRKWHPRWRLILWRGLLCAGLLVPMMQFTPVSFIRIPISEFPASPMEFPDATPPTSSGQSVPKGKPAIQPYVKSAEANGVSNAKNPILLSHLTVSKLISWQTVLPMTWAVVAAFAAFRLIRLQLQLNRLRRQSTPAYPALQEQVRNIQMKLGVKRKIDVRVSDSITSSFACGLLKPTILLSQKLAEELPSDETSALLAHEIAHFRRNDLFWCVGWRWIQAVFWFHPLVWKIPAVHNLACEQESDRLASGQMENRSDYSQLLARLALRILSLPKVETRLVLNGASQITQRLNHLKDGKESDWNWKYSAVAFNFIAALFLMVTGCEVSKSAPQEASTPKNTDFKKVLVVVQDQDGIPIEGATVSPTGFRVKGIHGADAYGWKRNNSGPPENAITDKDGKAWVKYPVMGIPDERELTGALILKVSDHGFASSLIQSYSVDSTENPVQLMRAVHLEVSAYLGADHHPVTDLIPVLEPDSSYTNENGMLVFDSLPPGGHLIQLMGRLPSGEIVYSDATAFTAIEGKPASLSLEMKPGIRLEGRIDDNVPRPVKNGRVMISVRAPQYPVSDIIEDYYSADEKYSGYTARVFWHSYRPINEDGTFVFESVPPGEADVMVLGDGFVSKTIGKLHNRINGIVTTNGPAMIIPQAFPLTTPVTKIEALTEPTATLELTATTKSGKPIEGVFAGMYPSAFRMWGPLGWKKDSSEEPYRQIPHLPNLDFSGTTDENGKLILQNVPTEEHILDVFDSKYQVPIQEPKGWRNRTIHTKFSPGETNKLTLVMEPKGTDYIGTSR